MGNQVGHYTLVNRNKILNQELAEFNLKQTLCNSSFLKTFQCERNRELCVVKVLFKRDPKSTVPDRHLNELKVIADSFSPHTAPNVFASQLFGVRKSILFVARQHFWRNLYDRMSTRPFLEWSEKVWISFQLLCAVEQTHSAGIVHGDIKSENVMLTTWGWALLTDFAPHKPRFLPEDNTENFSLFFDTMGRRSCSVAPERFYGEPGCDLSAPLTPQADIFSLGCVLAQLFLGGEALFDLAGLLEYRKGNLGPMQARIAEIPQEGARSLLLSMTQLDPDARQSAREYKRDWEGLLFPKYMRECLHPFVSSVLTMDADAKVVMANTEFESILGQLQHEHPEQHLPGLLVVVSLVCASLHHMRHASSSLLAVQLLSRCAEQLSDGLKLDRVLPYLVSLLDDPQPMVRSLSIAAISELLAGVVAPPRAEVDVFAEYVLPKLDRLCTTESSDLVRIMLGRHLASLAVAASRLLETSWGPGYHREHQSSKLSYEMALEELRRLFIKLVNALLTPPSAAEVRLVVLQDIGKLCSLFGHEICKNHILPIVITFLNDPDVSLRAAFFECIVDLARYAGSDSVHSYIQPCMLHGLYDQEPVIVERTVASLATLCQLGLYQPQDMKQMAAEAAALVCDPSHTTRLSAVALFASIGANLDPVDTFCFVMPQLAPFLKSDIADLSEASILESLRAPLPVGLTQRAMVYLREQLLEGEALDLVQMRTQLEAENQEQAGLLASMVPFMIKRAREALFVHKAPSQSQVLAEQLSLHKPEGSVPQEPEHVPRAEESDQAARKSYAMRMWQPQGIVFATLQEHTAAVRHLCAPEDGSFFVSGSDDATVRVWCTEHLEDDNELVHPMEGRVTALAVCEQSRTVAAADDNGQVCTLAVDFVRPVRGARNSAGQCARGMAVQQIPRSKQESYVLAMEHFGFGSTSLLACTNTAGEIEGWDLRSPSQAWRLQGPLGSGALTSLCVSPHRFWAAAGSARGFMQCWDLRFQVMALQWRDPRQHPVSHLRGQPCSSPEHTTPPVLISSSARSCDVLVWDVESGSCIQVLRALPPEAERTAPREAPALSSLPGAETRPGLLFDYGASELRDGTCQDSLAGSVRTMHAPPDSTAVLTGGSDGTIRYWNTVNVQESYTVSSTSKQPTRYVQSACEAEDVYQGALVFEEVPMGAAQEEHPSTRLAMPTAHHRDAILGMSVVDVPINPEDGKLVRLLLSSSRDGVIKVWK